MRISPLVNFVLLIVMLGSISSCCLISGHYGLTRNEIVSHEGYEAGDKYTAEFYKGFGFVTMCVLTVAAVVVFSVLLRSSPVFRSLIAWGLLIWGGVAGANMIRNWWHRG